MRPLAMLVLAVLVVLPTAAGHAQTGGPYDLRWNTFDGGGGASSGGIYALTGTAGQPDAGRASGGAYAVSGGFWVVGVHTLAVPSPGEGPVTAFRLLPAVPNPARGAVTVAFELPSERPVRVRVYDVAGHLMRVLLDARRPPGRHQVVWDGTGADGHPLAAGMYFTRVEAGEFSGTAKLVLLDPHGGVR